MVPPFVALTAHVHRGPDCGPCRAVTPREGTTAMTRGRWTGSRPMLSRRWRHGRGGGCTGPSGPTPFQSWNDAERAPSVWRPIAVGREGHEMAW